MAQADLAQLAGQPRLTKRARPWKEAVALTLWTMGLDSYLYVLPLVFKCTRIILTLHSHLLQAGGVPNDTPSSVLKDTIKVRPPLPLLVSPFFKRPLNRKRAESCEACAQSSKDRTACSFWRSTIRGTSLKQKRVYGLPGRVRRFLETLLPRDSQSRKWGCGI